MHFDFLIVLAFAVGGALLAARSRRRAAGSADPADSPLPDPAATLTTALAALASVVAVVLLLAWALGLGQVLRSDPRAPEHESLGLILSAGCGAVVWIAAAARGWTAAKAGGERR